MVSKVDKPVKIWVIGPRGFPKVQGGIEKFSEGLYPQLVTAGYEVTSFAIKRHCPQKNWKGIKFIRLKVPKSKSLERITYNFVATWYCIFNRPDIVHIHSIASGFFIFLLTLFRIKFIVRYNSRDYLHPKWGRFGRMILKISEKQVIWWANHIITNNQGYIKYLKSEGRKHNITFVPNGVNIYSKTKYKNCLKQFSAYGLLNQKFILAVGRITAEKNFETLIQAYLQVNAPVYKLVIVGEAAHNDSYAQGLKQKYQDNSDIIFTGKLEREALNCLYTHCKLFVLPSLHEGMPNVLLEAMSFSCPLLLSDISALTEFGFPKDTYFQTTDANTLSKKIDDCLKQQATLNYQHLLKNHHWEKIAQEILTIQKQLIK